MIQSRIKPLLILLFWFLISINGFSQSAINGSVLDVTDKSPVEYASVAIFSALDSSLVAGSITGQDGKFLISNLKPDNYFLKVSFLGYEPYTLSNLVVGKEEALELAALLISPNQQMLKAIEVTGDKVTTINKIDRQVFEAQTFKASKGGTATDVLRNLPSISVNAQGEITARGSGGFVVMLNGQPIQAPVDVILNQLPANAIQNVEIITTPSAKYDPEGKAGIINIILAQSAADGLFMQVNSKIGLPSIEDYDNKEYAQRHRVDFALNYRKGEWDFSLGASYLRNDLAGRREGNVYTIRGDTMTQFPSDGERSFDEVNLSGRFTLRYQPNDKNDFSLGFFGGERTKDRTADILYFDNHAVYNDQRIYTTQYYNENLRTRKGDFVLGSFDYNHRFDNQSSLSTSLLYEYTLLGGPTTNRNLGWPNTGQVLQDEYNTNDNPLNGLRYQLDYKSKPTNLGILEAGYQFRNLNHTGDFVYERRNNATGIFELVPAFSSEVDLRRTIHSGYLQLSGAKGKWDYGVGLRLEYMDRELYLKDKLGEIDTTYQYDFVKPFPTANVQYAFNDQLKLKAGYSRRVERTTTFKMNPFPEREHSETLEQGDPELLPEFVDLIEFGIVKDFGDNSIYTTAYLRNVENLVNRVNTINNDTILNRIYSNVGTGLSKGMEIGVDLKVNKWWKAFLGGNIYDYKIDGTFDNSPVETQSWVYSINANTTFDFPGDVSVQWSLNYISDRNTAQGEDSKFLSPNMVISKSFMDGQLNVNLQWLNMDMGLLDTNEQRITAFRTGEFYTTTNYVYEVDMIMLNLSYTLNQIGNKTKFIKSEFGTKEF